MSLLEIKNLTVEYKISAGFVRAVDDVSMKIEQGEYFGLVGESGCGKTTLARAILRLLPINGRIVNGEIWLKGKNIATMSQKQLRPLRWQDMSLIPQSAMNALDPVYRVGDQIVEAIRAHKSVSKDEGLERAAELFDLVGLDPARLEDYPHQFSGGMRQRAMIAMSLALSPDLIIADEPTTALDVIVKDQILHRMDQVQKQLKKSLLLVTHDVSAVAENCDRMAVMYAGKIMEHGRTAPLLRAPYNPYTLGLKNAFPRLHGPIRQLISIPGVPPDLLDPPKGCRFHHRCPFAVERCREEEPTLLEVEKDHFSACHFPEKTDEFRKLAAEVDTWQRIKPGMSNVPDESQSKVTEA
jgi:oligopeptide/dipeptide ABC transporter ATP-binding protein